MKMNNPMTIRVTTKKTIKRLFRKPIITKMVHDFGGNTNANIEKAIQFISVRNDIQSIRYGEYDEDVGIMTLLAWHRHNTAREAVTKADEEMRRKYSANEIDHRIEKEVNVLARQAINNIEYEAQKVVKMAIDNYFEQQDD